MYAEHRPRCSDCEANPQLMERLGVCGDVLPNNEHLPILVGPDADRCVVATFTQDQEAQEMAALIPTPWSPGALDGVVPAELPPRYRAMLTMARGWLTQHDAAKKGAAHG